MAEQVGVMSRCIKSLDGLAYTNIGRNLKTWSNFEDFLVGNSIAPSIYFNSINGAGAEVSGLDGTTLRPGWSRLQTGTTAAGRAALFSYSLARIFSGGEYTFEGDFYLPALSTAIEEFSLYTGFGDTYTGDQIDGAYFRYDRTVNVNWLACTANNSARTATDTLIPVVAGAWIRLKIIVNAAGTLVNFYINNILIASNIANIPTARSLGTLFSIVKSVGITTRSLYADWIWEHYNLTVTR